MNDAQTSDTTATVAEPDQEKGGRTGREAARYRTQLRQVEAERDQLAQRLEALQRRVAEQIIESEYGGKADGLWASGVAVADLVDDDGHIDPDKVKQAWRTAVGNLGIDPATLSGAYVPIEGRTPTNSAKPGMTWEELFKHL